MPAVLRTLHPIKKAQHKTPTSKAQRAALFWISLQHAGNNYFVYEAN
jgi:hypothetical protein